MVLGDPQHLKCGLNLLEETSKVSIHSTAFQTLGLRVSAGCVQKWGHYSPGHPGVGRRRLGGERVQGLVGLGARVWECL